MTTADQTPATDSEPLRRDDWARRYRAATADADTLAIRTAFLLAEVDRLTALLAEQAVQIRHLESDERIGAWHAVAAHPVLASCYDDGDVLLPAVLRRLDTLAEQAATIRAVQDEVDRWAALPGATDHAVYFRQTLGDRIRTALGSQRTEGQG